ncbi:hypothetical protein CY34DRAFT_744030 [Suillus luteus UH-Slu-Lm8-n1]|uniref:Uncharacterized protein n=1 Tax=Suillus luteus UH-Slu-Lm8-n1 TaxID=930992 RepID=A0A0D0AYS4_9AGAM|nr:hypothetical protein CY34DRAFT_744030 [Suillus luteus UH-Slu-Lm8-n1]
MMANNSESRAQVMPVGPFVCHLHAKRIIVRETPNPLHSNDFHRHKLTMLSSRQRSCRVYTYCSEYLVLKFQQTGGDSTVRYHGI